LIERHGPMLPHARGHAQPARHGLA
jgi:hypothetical protein